MEKANQAQLDDVKKLIKSLLITYQNGLDHFQLNTEYEEMEGSPIPFQNLGFSSYLDFLRSINDTVKFDRNKGGQYVLFPVIDANTAHIQKLVKEQRHSSIKRKYDSYLYSATKKARAELGNLSSAHYSKLNSQSECAKFKLDSITSSLPSNNEAKVKNASNCKQKELENRASSYDKLLEQVKMKQKSLSSSTSNYKEYLEDKYLQKEEVYLQKKAEYLKKKILEYDKERHSRSSLYDRPNEQAERYSIKYSGRILEEKIFEKNTDKSSEEEYLRKKRYEVSIYEEKSEGREERSKPKLKRSPHRSPDQRSHRSVSSYRRSNSKERSPNRESLKDKKYAVKEAPKKVDSSFQTEESYLADNSKSTQVEPDNNNLCDKIDNIDIPPQTEMQQVNAIEEANASLGTVNEMKTEYQVIGDPRIRKRLSNSEFDSDSQWHCHDYMYSQYSNVYTNRDPRLKHQTDTHSYSFSFYDSYSYLCDCTHCSPYGTAYQKDTQCYDYNYFNCNPHIYGNSIYFDAPVIPKVPAQQIPENQKKDLNPLSKKKLSLLDYKARQTSKIDKNSQNKSQPQPATVVTIPIEPTHSITDPRLLTNRVQSLATSK